LNIPPDVFPAAIVVAIMLLVGLPVHEFSHALAAYRLGDGTAKLFGRLTLNPIAHFDPVGGSLLALTFIGSAVTGTPFGFGWAKPTPVNPLNLEGGRRGEAIVAAAGPLSNLILATIGAIPLRFIIANPDLAGPPPQFIVANVLDLFVRINLLLMIFNFIPIPPLDGSKVLFAFLDRRTEYQIRPILEQYGFFILFALLFLPPGDSIGLRIIEPILDAFYKFLVGV
jgi:Zn-dependent protease